MLRIEHDPSQQIHDKLPNEVIGELLLRSGEMLYKPYVKQPDQMDELANKTALILPFYEMDLQHDPGRVLLEGVHLPDRHHSDASSKSQ